MTQETSSSQERAILRSRAVAEVKISESVLSYTVVKPPRITNWQAVRDTVRFFCSDSIEVVGEPCVMARPVGLVDGRIQIKTI